jgi:tetratricopeptide (TPR) repeat protein
MTTTSHFLRLTLAAGLSVLFCAQTLSAEEARISKDVGPSSAVCDTHAKGTPAWTDCVGRASAAMSDTDLFYAGYWLAKSGQYEKALGYLSLARSKDERVLTYIGYATRKLGHVDEALPLYEQALALNPNYVVARAYLGEAFLTKSDPARAKMELAEIERRCGATCPAYVDLKSHIADYEAAVSKG